ncbi:hypothetical protein GEMRC1_008981 [Eukaryota sp. GEM-RC1]
MVFDNLEEGQPNALHTLTDLLHRYQQENHEFSVKLDQVFDQRKQKEEENESLSSRIRQIEQDLSHQVAEMDQSSRHQYESLKNKRDQLQQSIVEGDDVCRQLSTDLEGLKLKISSNNNASNFDWIQEYEQLTSEIKSLEHEISSHAMTLSPDEEKRQLTNRVRELNTEIQALKGEHDAIREGNLELQDKISGLQEKSQEKSVEKLDSKSLAKYDQLKKQEVDISEFMSKYPNMQKELTDKIKEKSAMINNLVLFLIKELKITSSAALDLSSLSLDKAVKENETKSASEILKLKKAELQKLKKMEESVSQEETKFMNLIRKMKTEMQQFSNADEIKEKCQKDRQVLTSSLRNLEKRASYYGNVIENLKTEILDMEKTLSRHNVAAELAKMDKVFSIQQAKITKTQMYVEKFNDIVTYSNLRDECQEIAEQVNRNLKTQLI